LEIKRNPKSVIVGVISQFILLPFATFLVILVIKPLPELALGMILVAASPGGNVSNFFSQQSKGNIALSVSLTAIASIAAILMTPFNFEFYAELYLGSLSDVQQIEIEFLDIFKKIFTILVIPLLVGITFTTRLPKITQKIKGPIGIISFLILVTFMVVAFSKNIDVFLAYYQYIIVLVLAHNALAFGVGYGAGKLAKLPGKDVRTITIETGIQNSGLSLAIIFSVFDGNGGMALLAAWWGIWHIFSGTIISFFFRRANGKTD
jgi:BASS family bile acid:Na+ symporter